MDPRDAVVILRERLAKESSENSRLREELNKVYSDRNLVVLAFAKLADLIGWDVRYGRDHMEPDWPVLYIQTPYGQVSWHLPIPACRLSLCHDGKWDGHSNDVKHKRLVELIESHALSAPAAAVPVEFEKGNFTNVDLSLTEEEKAKLQELHEWHKQSALSKIQLGVPLEQQGISAPAEGREL